MDAFFASVEQLDNPQLKGKPVVVGGNSKRGVIAAASYEARKYGIKSAMSSAEAVRLCPDLIFVRHKFDRYREISHEVRSIFSDYTNLVEPLSLDEAYLDVTNTVINITEAIDLANEIRKKIESTIHLTASAGISINKFLAKTASDVNKPNGFYSIDEEEALDFTARLPIHKFHGIGKVTTERMKRSGVFHGRDLRRFDLKELNRRYGKIGNHFFNISRGIDHRPVTTYKERKSISVETTFDKNIMKLDELSLIISKLCRELYLRYQNKGIAKTINLKIKYGDFSITSRSRTDDRGFQHLDDILISCKDLLNNSILDEHGIRLIGVGLSNFKTEKPDGQLKIKFPNYGP